MNLTIRFALAMLVCSCWSGPGYAEEPALPSLSRIKVATVAAADVNQVEEWYTRWLQYRVREKGAVTPAMATSWGLPAARGRSYVVMSTKSDPDVFIRAIQTDPVEGYQPATTWGWNAFEIVIDDIDAVYEQMKESPFEIIGYPHPLKNVPSIHAMQVIGPGKELLYLTTQTGDRAKSPLPLPLDPVGRLFILVLGGPDIVEIRDWYADNFQLQRNSIRTSNSQVVQQAWGLPDGTHPITLLRLGQHGNSIQLDGYTHGKGARPRPEGQLPPGCAMASFSVPNLDEFEFEWISPPTYLEGAVYNGGRSATVIGPAGEFLELIEEAQH